MDEIKAALSGMLSPERKRARWAWSKCGNLQDFQDRHRAGCYVTEGLARAAARRCACCATTCVIHEGELDSLKRFKDDVREVKAGFECGLSLKNFDDLKVGDQLEVYEVVEVARTL